MLFVGSDDGQLHAFDGGIFRGTDCKLPLPADGAPGSFRGDNNFTDATASPEPSTSEAAASSSPHPSQQMR